MNTTVMIIEYKCLDSSPRRLDWAKQSPILMPNGGWTGMVGEELLDFATRSPTYTGY